MVPSRIKHISLWFRRGVRHAMGYGLAAAVMGLCLVGAFLPGARTSPALWALLGGLSASFLWLRRGQWVRLFAGHRALPRPLELPLLTIAGTALLVQRFGGHDSAVAPAMFVVVAGIGALSGTRVHGVAVAVAVALETALYSLTEGRGFDAGLALHLAFLATLGFLGSWLTQVEIAQARNRSEQALEKERARVKDDARLFRLASPSSVSEPADEERLFRASLDEVHSSTFHVLELLKKTMGLHTAALLFLDEAGETVRIVELCTDADDLREDAFPRGEGVVGAVLSRGVATNLAHIRPGYSGLCYYKGPAPVRSFVGVPVRDGKNLLGVLCCDRIEDRPFTVHEENTLGTAVLQLLRTLENERVFVQLERQKREQTSLYRASQNLGAAMTEDAVLEAGFASAAELAPHELCVVTRYDPADRRHRVVRARGEGAEALTGLSFRDNSSLTAMVVKNQHYLPYRGDFDSSQQVVFTKRTRFPDMSSLLVMPLVVREDAVGTMMLAAKRRHAFADTVRPSLQLLANQMAVALSNAQAVRRLEQMATTDGLTGCLNKRAFLDELDRKFRSAGRFGRELSLIVTDIDHFKTVNDTYGHALGDVVLKGLAGILQRVKRETDIVARFGGEEFCVLCEETGEEGALLLAERIREELAAHVFDTEMGKLQVTTSLGVATFPLHAQSTEELFERADKALYVANRNGRNQVATAASGKRSGLAPAGQTHRATG